MASIEYLLPHLQPSDYLFSPLKGAVNEVEDVMSKSDLRSLTEHNSSTACGVKILYIQMQYCEGENLQEFFEKYPERQ